MKPSFIGKSVGRSMNPLINEGDRLYIKRIRKKDIQIGDIVVFYKDKKFVSHRVIGREKSRVIAKGDNALYTDKSLDYAEILGKLVKIEGKYGTIDLETLRARIFQIYLLIYSLTGLYIPKRLFKYLSKIFRGRRFITKRIAH